MSHGQRHSPTAEQLAANRPLLGPRGRLLAVSALVIGAVGLAASYLLGNGQADNLRHFYFAYLVAYCFWLSIALGALFYTLIHHLLRDTSSVVVRRIAEQLAGTLPFMALLILPILIPILSGSSELYWWLDPVVRESDALIIHKSGYLNLGFFVARLAVYFAVWIALAGLFRGISLRQDATGGTAPTLQLWKYSAPAMLLFAVTTTFFAVDVIMALDAHWFSTIFGVYFFAGCMVGAYGLLVLSSVLLQAGGYLRAVITPEHYHDLGKLLFAFLFFWGYIAFSQFMLYWYGNIPEETGWYLRRFSGDWLGWSVALLFLHLLIPFPIMLSRFIKRRRKLLAVMAVWLLIAHWLDLYWLIMPEYNAAALPLSLLDLTCLVGVGGLMLGVYIWLAGGQALVPVRDPNLTESLNFENV
ncbi:quinol:cytochrome C oxidoreductase [bacterium]|nr:quinol:cytochrome C oxidoreductase [bacterium]